jgi:hypothetical protein
MKQIIGSISFFLIMALGIFSCKKDKPTVPDMGYDYFPNQVGRYVVYDVDSFYYDNFHINLTTYKVPIDTFKFQLKEKIESIFYDNQNRPTIRLERYVKHYNDTLSYASMPWALRNVWAENRTATTAEKVEENVRYIKLAFPVTINQTWNGNAQNTLAEWDYNYSFFGLPRTVGSIHLDSVLQVNQFDDNNSILTQRQLYTEKYARNVGLVYKQVIDVQSQPNPAWNLLPFGSDTTAAFFGKPILQRVTSGIQYTWTINSYGTE